MKASVYVRLVKVDTETGRRNIAGVIGFSNTEPPPIGAYLECGMIGLFRVVSYDEMTRHADAELVPSADGAVGEKDSGGPALNARDISIRGGNLYFRGELVGAVTHINVAYILAPGAPISFYPPGAIEAFKRDFRHADVSITDEGKMKIKLNREGP